MPPEVGSGSLEVIVLAMGMAFARGIHHFKPNMNGQIVPLLDVTGELSEPTLIITVARSGRVMLKERCVGTDFIFGPGSSLFQHVDRIDYVPMLDASSNSEVSMLKIEEGKESREG